MRKRIFTSTVAALALFAVVGLVSTLAPSIAWPNLARAHSPGSATLTALTVTAGGTAQTLSPAFSSTVTDYTVNVENSVAQVTVAGTPDGDGTVTYQYTDADSGTDGHQVNLPTLGRKRINVVVTHTDSGTTATQTYTVLVIREGTVATDRAALLALYNSTGGADWTNNTNWGSTEPLDMWHGVYTNADGRVTQLNLWGNNLDGILPAALGNLDQMIQLYLWGNQLSEAIPTSLGSLTNLQELDLSNNRLTGSIPDELGSLTNLQELSLGYNRKFRGDGGLSGTIPASLGNLTNLQELDLSNNRLTGSIPDELGSLTNLQELSLDYNRKFRGDGGLSGTIPASLGNLTNLQELDLSHNRLTGSIPDELGSLTNLQELSLDYNRNFRGDGGLSGTIPASLGNLTKLTRLYLYNNQLTGEIPEELGNLASLQYLRLGSNQLTGAIPEELGNLASLQSLHLYNNQLTGEIPEELGNLTSLRLLYLYNNQLTGEIPEELGNLTSLSVLYLYNNQLTGEIPEELGNLASLVNLYLQENQLTGEIPEELGNLASLVILDLDNNQLTGEIPEELGNLASLVILYLGNNQLTGAIPEELGNLASLRLLYLYNNQLTGEIPEELGNLASLQHLYLDNNQLTGEIPEELGNLARLRFLHLDNNQLTGEIPEELGNLNHLFVARFAGNALTGCVPNGLRWLMTATDLDRLPAQDFIAVDANGDGDTPGLGLPFCTLKWLTLSGVTLAPAFASDTVAYTASATLDVLSTTVMVGLYNNSDTVAITKGADTYMSGDPVPLNVGENVITITVTPTDGTPTLTYTVTIFRAGVDQETLMALYNRVGGATWTDKTNWGSTTEPLVDWFGVEADSNGNVTELELSGNNLSGTLPASLGSLTSLTTLDLSDNRLSGTIPDLGALSSLTTLNLGDNQVSGTIPDWLSSLTSLTTLNLRDNGLTGPIPDALGNLNQLDVLYLDNNQLSGPIPAALGDLSGLQATRFAGNSLTGCVPDGLRRLVTSLDYAMDFPAQDFIAVDANNDGDTTDDGDTPGLELPFCTLRTLTFSGNVTLAPAFASDTVVYAASAALNVTSTTVTATLHNSSDTVSIMKGAVTYMSGDPVPLEVGPNVITISVTTMDDTPSPHTYTVTVTRAPNTPPTFTDGLTTTRGVDENTAAGQDIGDPVAATDTENDTLTYSLDATGAASFDIISTTGQLLTKAALNFETTPSYSVTVTATDTGAATDTIIITITVNNLEEPGTVTLSSLQPLVAIPLTTTLDDPDVVSGSVTWSWERSPDGTSDWTPISGATSDTYTPVFDDVGDYLRATASYIDGEGPSGKSAQAISANAVEVAPGRNKPVLREYPTATRSVPRNTPAGRNIGSPFTATDADNDALTYSLDGPDGADFALNTSSGQLLTKALLTGIQRTRYIVFVSVSDGKDDLGEPETDPQIDTSTEVTINVTTTSSGSSGGGSGRSGGGGGGGGGGGSGRATPTPTPTPSPTPTATPTPTGPQFSGLIAAEPNVTATVVPEGTTLGLNGGGDLPGGVYLNFPPTAVALPVHVSVSVSNEASSDVTAPSGTTLLPLTINITTEPPLILGEPLTIEINPTPEQLEAAGGDLNNLSVGVVTPNGIVVLPAQVLHGRLVVTTDRIAPFVLLAITDTGPVLTQPPLGDASSMGPLLKWTQPPRTTWFQVQVIPFNEDGPGINLVIGDRALVRAAQYQVLGPNFGSADPNYVMLPGMTYLWRVRTTTVLTNPTEDDWSAWAVSSFKTPPASSSTITPVSPPAFGEVSTLTPTLTWANSNTAVFYYEVQVSKDYEFGPNAFLYSEYVHGGASTPPNSYVVPEAFPLEAGEIYYWRVRPRIQGDGDPLPWSAAYVFLAPG